MEDHHNKETSRICWWVFLTLVLIPQLYKTYKLKKADEISEFSSFMSIITSILFLTYAMLLNQIQLLLLM